jgi:CRISPR/Cas system CSM-associated protein Csm2 small subunit
MNLDSTAYKAYKKRMESRLVEIELRMESIFATPLTMMPTERMNSETERVNWEFRMELQRAEREAHWDQQQEDFKEMRMTLVYTETRARLERLNAIIDQMNDTTDQINRILESCGDNG